MTSKNRSETPGLVKETGETEGMRSKTVCRPVGWMSFAVFSRRETK